MKIKVLFFGALQEIVGAESIELENISNTAHLSIHLKDHYSDLEKYKYRVAVNHEIIESKQELKDGDEIALLPPFAGG